MSIKDRVQWSPVARSTKSQHLGHKVIQTFGGAGRTLRALVLAHTAALAEGALAHASHSAGVTAGADVLLYLVLNYNI